MSWSVFAESLECVTKLKATNSTKEKQEILSQYKDNQVVCQLFYYTYHPMFKYKITEKALSEAMVIPDLLIEGSPFEMCKTLANSNINNKLRNAVKTYIEMGVPVEYKALIQGMVLKDLGVRMDVKSINKAIPKLIPAFAVALANPVKKQDALTKEYKWHKFKANEWVSISLKLNGVRAVNVGGQFFTRTGREITGMKHIIKDLGTLCHLSSKFDLLNGMVFDGELLIKNINDCGDLIRSDDENFQESKGVLNRKDRTEEEENRFEFVIFDVITVKEFYSGESVAKYKERSETLFQLQKIIKEFGLKHIRVVPIYYQGAYSQDTVEQLLDMTDNMGFEGLMINKDATYQTKRSNNVLKVKSWYYNDCKVIGFEEGNGEAKGTLGSIIVDYKGYPCGVHGFKDEVRDWIWANQDEVLGRVICVKCKGETKNEKGGVSMQFPTFQHICDEDKKVSYES